MQNAYATRIERVESCTDVSFFRLREKVWKERKCPPYPMHRFFTLMRKMRARSYVSERLELNSELVAEQEMATKRCGGAVTIKQARRLTFFASLPGSGSWRDSGELPDGQMLGYAVVVTLRLPNRKSRTFLLEAVVQPPGVVFQTGEESHRAVIIGVPNYYVHNVRPFETVIGTRRCSRKFFIRGSFFTQQNDLTSVCAHAALRTAVNSSPRINLKGPTGSSRLTNEYINTTLGLDFGTPDKSVGHYDGDSADTKEGLNATEIRTVVESIGARLLVGNFVQDSSVEYDEFMYPLVESHYPTILEVQGWDIKDSREYAHGVAVMGHTLNSDRWAPEANYGYGNYPIRSYIPVSEWVCHFVISDDNFGMNVTLPSDMIRNDMVPSKNPKLHATRVLSILPKQVTVDGYRAQREAMRITVGLVERTQLSPENPWLNKLKERNERHSLVCRTLLLRKKEYLNYIKDQVDGRLFKPTKKQWGYFGSLPTYLWVTEVTIPNLYAGNKTKLGEVVINACCEAEKVENYLCLAWFPGFMRLRAMDRSELWYVGGRGHVPLIRAEPEPLIEW